MMNLSILIVDSPLNIKVNSVMSHQIVAFAWLLNNTHVPLI